jgi:DNA-binding CsgD family transcriptional regulator
MPEGSEEQQRWLAELERQSATTEMASRLLRAFHKIDLRDVAPLVQTPTLVFHVKNDAMVPFEEGRRLASLIPDARFFPLDGENHILLSHEPAWHRFVSELQHFLSETDELLYSQQDGFGELTPRERDVLDLIAQGVSNTQIAECLCISPKTVRNHVTRIFGKLEVGRRAEAIVQAREAGFGRTVQRKDSAGTYAPR